MIAFNPLLLALGGQRPASVGSFGGCFGTGASRFAAGSHANGDTAALRAQRRLSSDFERAVTTDKVVPTGEYDRLAADNDVDRLKSSGPVVVFSTGSSEPESSKAVRLLRLAGAEPRLIKLDEESETGVARRAALARFTQCSTLPSIWIGGQYVGGCNEGPSEAAPGVVHLAFSDTLREKLGAAAKDHCDADEECAASRDAAAAFTKTESPSERTFREQRTLFFYKAAMERAFEHQQR